MKRLGLFLFFLGLNVVATVPCLWAAETSYAEAVKYNCRVSSLNGVITQFDLEPEAICLSPSQLKLFSPVFFDNREFNVVVFCDPEFTDLKRHQLAIARVNASTDRLSITVLAGTFLEPDHTSLWWQGDFYLSVSCDKI